MDHSATGVMERASRPVRIEPSAPPPERRPSRSSLAWLFLALVLVALAWLRWGASSEQLAAAPAWLRSASSVVRAAPRKAPGQAAARLPVAVPVRVAQVTVKDVPVEFRSVGTVEAIASVAIRARVDGVVSRILVADGAEVKAGEALVELDGAPIQAQIDEQSANVRRDQAQLRNAQLSLNRTTDLAGRGATSKQALDDAQTSVQTLAAQLAASQAQLHSLQLQQAYTHVTAPFDGRIGRIRVSLGAIVRASDASSTIATLNQISPIYVAMGVPQDLLGDLSTAEQANTARIEALLPSSTESRGGPVSVVDNQVEQGTGLVTVRARFDNGDQRLWPGTVLDARLILRDEPGALVVPSNAVQISQTGSFVFVLGQDKKVKIVPVKVGLVSGAFTQVLDGPPAGAMVVVDGQLRLNDGSSVTVVADAPGAGAAP